MAHNAQAVFFKTVKKNFPDAFVWKNVLEVGSLNINGTVRNLFDYCNYVGVDVGLGPGVDFAVPGQDVAYPDESFDVTISAECFEHNPMWKETFANMKRMTKPNGLITFTCAGLGRAEHGTARTDAGSSPLTVGLGWDYYRNLEESDFEQDEKLLQGLRYQFFYNEGAHDLYFVGVKNGPQLYGVEETLIEEQDWNNINAENL